MEADKTFKCKGERSAEQMVDRYLERHPDHVVRVFVDGKLQGFVTTVPTSDKRPLGYPRR